MVERGGDVAEEVSPSGDGGFVLSPCNSAQSVNVIPRFTFGLCVFRPEVSDRPPRESFTVGVGSSFPSESSDHLIAAPALAERCLPDLAAAGVGSKDEQSLTSVGGSHVASSNAAPATVIPERGQVPENSSEPHRPMAGHVLQEDVSGS